MPNFHLILTYRVGARIPLLPKITDSVLFSFSSFIPLFIPIALQIPLAWISLRGCLVLCLGVLERKKVREAFPLKGKPLPGLRSRPEADSSLYHEHVNQNNIFPRLSVKVTESSPVIIVCYQCDFLT